MEKILEKYFGFKEFRRGQRDVIEKILNKESAIAIFATGSGKSLCYQLPALELENLTLVISPLLSLMQDQLDFLKEKKIPAEKIDSFQSREEFIRIMKEAKENKIKILMISPERMKNEVFRSYLKGLKIDLMVVDEAHSISEWGHNFRPDYLKLPIYMKEFNIKNVLLLTATATKKVVEDMKNQFEILDNNIFITNFYRENLEMNVVSMENREKNSFLLKELKSKKNETTIIYTTQQKTSEEVSEFLNTNGFISRAYHAGKSSEERDSIQNMFMNGDIKIIVATIAFGMGIDKNDIRNIYHYNLPKSLENYAQEIGRAGRDGKKSRCVVMASSEDLIILRNFIYGDCVDILSISNLLKDIENNKDDEFHVIENSFSKKYNIKILPLKTLLVYLEMMNILNPEYTSFKSLQLKFLIKEMEIKDKLSKISDDNLLENLFLSLERKKIWNYLNMEDFLDKVGHDKRSDIMDLLRDMEENNFIEFKVKDFYQVYKIKNKPSEKKELLKSLNLLFQKNLNNEVKRLNIMFDFFQSKSCLSVELSKYFNENLNFEKCNHCSVCLKNIVTIPKNINKELDSLNDFKIEDIKFLKLKLNEYWNVLNISKYLNGIKLPILDYKDYDKSFGIFQEIEFDKIEEYVSENFFKKDPIISIRFSNREEFNSKKDFEKNIKIIDSEIIYKEEELQNIIKEFYFESVSKKKKGVLINLLNLKDCEKTDLFINNWKRIIFMLKNSKINENIEVSVDDTIKKFF